MGSRKLVGLIITIILIISFALETIEKQKKYRREADNRDRK
jgi:hypothetical protein